MYPPKNYLREIVVRVSFGCFDWLHQQDRQCSISITDPEYNDGNVFSITIDESDADGSWPNRDWADFLPYAMDLYHKRSRSSITPVVAQWLDDWKASQKLDDGFETALTYNYAKAKLPSVQSKLESVKKELEKLEKWATFDTTLRELDDEKQKATA